MIDEKINAHEKRTLNSLQAIDECKQIIVENQVRTLSFQTQLTQQIYEDQESSQNAISTLSNTIEYENQILLQSVKTIADTSTAQSEQIMDLYERQISSDQKLNELTQILTDDCKGFFRRELCQ